MSEWNFERGPTQWWPGDDWKIDGTSHAVVTGVDEEAGTVTIAAAEGSVPKRHIGRAALFPACAERAMASIGRLLHPVRPTMTAWLEVWEPSNHSEVIVRCEFAIREWAEFHLNPLAAADDNGCVTFFADVTCTTPGHNGTAVLP